MVDCKLCKVSETKELLDIIKLYEDDVCIAVLSKKPASICHVILFPKQHATIIEQVSDAHVEHMFGISNKLSQAMFESLNIQGTNIFIQNGTSAGQEDPHFSIHIVARRENDEIKLDWEPKQLTEEEMSTVELQYKQMTQGAIFKKEDESKPAAATEGNSEGAAEEEDEDEENYKLKYFDRRP